ncbi:MAG: metalloregulator ArsR/SmtB family transcription factor [Leptolyngbyaceae cyanobacterium MO_188.B28]|nr:metalloregulator ArsR/SmtB family transcription factor [Leptolyngbyaceae cyanobacterium MO_188.B28]
MFLMSIPHFETLLAFFKALANESRLKLIGLLAQREHSVEEMAALLQLKEPTVSHHLAKLKQLKLVEMRQDKNTHFYRLNQAALQSMSKAMFTPEHIVGLTADVDTDGWESKILRSYFEDGRLRELPASRKKRRVVLKWLVNQLDQDRRYAEKELNQVLKQFHADVATLRREFIGYNMMQRERGRYWRMPEVEWRTEA